MGFALKVPITKELLKEIQYELMHRLGKEFFFSSLYNDDGTQHAVDFLEAVPVLDGFNGPEISGTNLVKVNLWTRYYGPDYERGEGLKICGVMLYLLLRPDVAGVWYGGDSGGVSGMKFNQVQVIDLLNHWAIHGHHPYEKEFDVGGSQKNPKCSYCLLAMIRNGYGERYASFYCAGCGEYVTYRNENFDAWQTGQDINVTRYGGIAQQLETK
jgi:predicted RNA-binding Zn-ribbon protein involved in translation (DUF1610 family)